MGMLKVTEKCGCKKGGKTMGYMDGWTDWQTDGWNIERQMDG